MGTMCTTSWSGATSRRACTIGVYVALSIAAVQLISASLLRR